jgi:hypothetical protein
MQAACASLGRFSFGRFDHIPTAGAVLMDKDVFTDRPGVTCAKERLTADSAAHTNCAHCYARLLAEDPRGAREIFDAAWEYAGAR